jgi:NIPSNAP protein
MIYEIREYTTVPGRMPALVKRFNNHTLGYFRKHGMEVVFLSVTELGANSNNELVYVLQFDSYDDMESKWAAFQADPGWRDARSASEADGPIVASISRRVLSAAPFTAAEE